MLDAGSKFQGPVADSYQQVVGKSFKFVLRKVEVPDIYHYDEWHSFRLLGDGLGGCLKQVDKNKTGDGK